MIGGFLTDTADPLQPADAIVPLAGERSRVFYAATLFRKGFSPYYIITDMWVVNPDPGFNYVESVRGQAMDSGVPPERILVANGKVATTYQEAQSLRRLALEQHLHSLIVVTSPYHTRRALLIFHEVFRDSGISINVQSVPDNWYSAENWWKTPDGRQVTIEEYLKLALFLMFGH